MNREDVERLIRCGQESLPFVAIRCNVMRGGERVATAASNTMAKRIANALNNYTPNRRGY